MGHEAIDRFLMERIEKGEIPGAAYAIVEPGGVVAEGAVGRAMVSPESAEATLDTIYDLGSLTKPLITSLLFLALGPDLGLGPDDPVRRFLPEVDRLDKHDIMLRHLLTHTSGLPAWMPLYLRGSTIGEYLAQVRDRPPESAPGTRVVYSDVGYMMLAEILARCATVSLDRLAEQAILRPLGLQGTTFNPPRRWLPRVAPTEDSCHYERKLASEQSNLAASYTGFRTGIIHGQVHDQNAWALGGVAGHAGLFSTARETAALALEYLGAGSGLLGEGALRAACTDRTEELDEARSFAFRLALRGETSAGPALPPVAFGHTGFPGTSVWVDPARRRAYVLLTNRIHPRAAEGFDMTPLRQRFHALASAA